MDDINERIKILIDLNDPYYLQPSTFNDIHQEIKGWNQWRAENIPSIFYVERQKVLHDQLDLLKLSVGDYESALKDK